MLHPQITPQPLGQGNYLNVELFEAECGLFVPQGCSLCLSLWRCFIAKWSGQKGDCEETLSSYSHIFSRINATYHLAKG